MNSIASFSRPKSSAAGVRPRSNCRSRFFRSRSLLLGIVVLTLEVAGVNGSSLVAKEKDDLKITLTAHSVVRDANGAESLVANPAVEPGDVVVYTAVYRNDGTQPLRQLVPTLPVPAGMELLSGSVQPTPAAVSLDGKKFEPYPVRRTLKLSDGREVSREVPASAYRAVRWSAADLSPQGEITVAIRARVSAGNKTEN